MANCPENREAWWCMEKYIYAVDKWPNWTLSLKILIHFFFALLGSIRKAPFPAAGQADKWCDKTAWGRYWRWHYKRNLWWDLRADFLGAKWTPDDWWDRKEIIKVIHTGGGYQELTLRLWVLKKFPLIALPFIEWRSDTNHISPRDIPRRKWHFPFLKNYQHKWHVGWQDGRALNFEFRMHKR